MDIILYYAVGIHFVFLGLIYKSILSIINEILVH